MKAPQIFVFSLMFLLVIVSRQEAQGATTTGPPTTSTTTTAQTPTPAPATVPTTGCYVCDSTDPNQIDCADDGFATTNPKYDKYKETCPTGWCEKDDYTEKNKTKNKDLNGRMTAKERKITRIIRRCPSQTDVEDNMPKTAYNNNKDKCAKNKKYNDNRGVQRCFCTTDFCNGSPLTTTNVLLVLALAGFVLSAQRSPS